MLKAFDISKYAATLNESAPTETRDIETVTAEIIQLQQDAGNAIIGIGKRLIEAKAMIPHGEWLPWLAEEVGYSERVAQSFMRLAREWESNPKALSDLGATKALKLLVLPPEERETFMAGNNVVDMTSRELEKAIRERDEARQAAEAARADAQTAEESRAKMEADMRALKEMHQSALDEAEQAAEDLLAAEKELEELRNRPVDVAVEVDREAVEKARAEAVAGMQAKVDAAESARKEAEDRRKDAEKALSKAKKEAGANAAILSRAEKAEAELAEARRQLEAAAKAESASLVNQNGDLALFNVIFNQTQESVNKMHGLRLKMGKDDGALDKKLKTAISALADAVRRCAE